MEGLLSSLSKADGPPTSNHSNSAVPGPHVSVPSDIGWPAATETASSSRAPSPPPTDLDTIQRLSERLDDLVIEAVRLPPRGRTCPQADAGSDSAGSLHRARQRYRDFTFTSKPSQP